MTTSGRHQDGARLGRRHVGIEAEPGYVRVGRRRVRLLGGGAGG
jgi:hypothetical protein